MPGKHLSAEARRVVVGFDTDGKSTILEDADTTTRLAGPGNTKCDIWRLDGLPATLMGSDGLTGTVETHPTHGGLVYRVVTFPPDSEWDRSVGYSDGNGALPGSLRGDAIPGMHITDSLDIVTILSGVLHLVLETGEETALHPGDTLVMNGNPHAWSNKGDEPVTLVSLMMSALPRTQG